MKLQTYTERLANINTRQKVLPQNIIAKPSLSELLKIRFPNQYQACQIYDGNLIDDYGIHGVDAWPILSGAGIFYTCKCVL